MGRWTYLINPQDIKYGTDEELGKRKLLSVRTEFGKACGFSYHRMSFVKTRQKCSLLNGSKANRDTVNHPKNNDDGFHQ